ncbi:hypothetical protein TNCV_254871 [Trichonephila clavipes]|nr:hypothetical protein TNCV_254871 [Trichonephila clavipes]
MCIGGINDPKRYLLSGFDVADKILKVPKTANVLVFHKFPAVAENTKKIFPLTLRGRRSMVKIASFKKIKQNNPPQMYDREGKTEGDDGNLRVVQCQGEIKTGDYEDHSLKRSSSKLNDM